MTAETGPCLVKDYLEKEQHHLCTGGFFHVYFFGHDVLLSSNADSIVAVGERRGIFCIFEWEANKGIFSLNGMEQNNLGGGFGSTFIDKN